MSLNPAHVWVGIYRTPTEVTHMENALTPVVVLMLVITLIGGNSLSNLDERADSQEERLDTEAEWNNATFELVGDQLELHEQVMDDRHAEVTSSISSLETRASDLELQVSDLRIDAIEADIANLSARLDAQAAEIELLKNQPPVIYFRDSHPEDEDRDDQSSDWYISAIDIDGEIVSLGLDTDLDGIIDLELVVDNYGNPVNYSDVERYERPSMYSTMDVVRESGSGDDCEGRMNIIAIDDDGAVSIFSVSKEVGNTGSCS